MHDGRWSMAAACSWRLLVYGGCSFIAAARSWRPLVHGGCSFMCNCAILKGNSLCGLCEENYVISSAGGSILSQSISHSATNHFTFYDKTFCILLQSI